MSTPVYLSIGTDDGYPHRYCTPWRTMADADAQASQTDHHEIRVLSIVDHAPDGWHRDWNGVGWVTYVEPADDPRTLTIYAPHDDEHPKAGTVWERGPWYLIVDHEGNVNWETDDAGEAYAACSGLYPPDHHGTI